MIYTITLNPSIDYSMTVKDMNVTKINRSEEELSSFGGKGINVSAMLGNLGIDSTALGFSGGYTGMEIERLCKRCGIACDFVKIREDSRINVKILSESECAINGKGPMIYLEEEEELLKKLSALSEKDMVILSGNAPESESGKLLENVMEAVSHTIFVADMDGVNLDLAIDKRPYLIKPNEYELAALFGKERFLEEREIIAAAANLRDEGVKNVLVSCGGSGAILAAEDGNFYKIKAPEVQVVNTVGAGDSLLAGFVAARERGKPFDFSLALAVASGSATAASSGIAEGEMVLSLLADM
ncbi:MAG: 1-phosphofructokinase family hexose kinase [Oscillospiraceae bacterium]|nr:1-phosphofructokinase family hexose kinase [Oscillospiraceae bacterium]MBQ7120439.1 1-phosphofructokinase family hexose kinase [Oscillospiraceae bacterium]